MAFAATLSPESALQPQYEGANKVETWLGTAGASDSGPATIQARYLTEVTDFDVQSFNGTGPSSYQMSGDKLILTLPGTTTATLFRIKLKGRYA